MMLALILCYVFACIGLFASYTYLRARLNRRPR